MFQRLDQFHVFGSWTFRALAFGERNALTFAKLLKAYAIKTRLVKEHVFASPRVNKSESFVRQSLDRAFSHFVRFLFEFRDGGTAELVAPAIHRKGSIIQSSLYLTTGSGERTYGLAYREF